MSWDVIGQERVVEALRRAVASDRVAHAYLFYGPDGVGKRAVALHFARMLECQDEDGVRPCGACNACRKVQRMVHPDVHVMLPQPTDADADDIAARYARLGEDAYAAVDFVRRPVLDDPTKTSNKQALYTVARVHDELRRTMSFKPVEGRYKFALITDAERMRPEAANAFLKLLEEPTPRTVFVLTTRRPDALLPTITSRCQKIRFDSLAPDAIASALSARGAADGKRAAMLARMADGSVTRALDLAGNDDLLADRAAVVEFLRLAFTRNVEGMAEHTEKLARLGRERLKGVLGLMLSWVRDLVLFRTLDDAALLVNVDQSQAVANFCRNLPDADLEAMVALVEEAGDLVERNVNQALVVTALGQALGHAMRGRHDGRLYRALV